MNHVSRRSLLGLGGVGLGVAGALALSACGSRTASPEASSGAG